MNLDFSQYPELNGPIVLLIGCPRDASDRLRLLDDTLVEANAQTVEVIDVLLDSETRWWILPFQEDSMFQIFKRYTRKSYQTIVKWIGTDKFVVDVREFLGQLVHDSTSLEHLPENWPELVSLVILGESIQPESNPYVHHVFDGWFPNAQFR